MDIGGVNILAVVVGAIAGWVAGMLWYSPVLFGNLWLSLIGKKKEGMKPAPSTFILGFLSILTTAFFIGFLMEYTPLKYVSGGIAIAGALWLGFAATGSLDSVVYEGRPWGLWALNNGYRFLSYLAIAIVYGAWM